MNTSDPMKLIGDSDNVIQRYSLRSCAVLCYSTNGSNWVYGSQKWLSVCHEREWAVKNHGVRWAYFNVIQTSVSDICNFLVSTHFLLCIIVYGKVVSYLFSFCDLFDLIMFQSLPPPPLYVHVLFCSSSLT